MKKIGFIVCLVFLYIMCSSVVFGEMDDTGDYEISIDGTDCTITKYHGAGGDVTIPNKLSVGGVAYDVKVIGEKAFMDCSDITKVSLPDGVTSIGGWAFYSCSGLTTIILSEGVVSIGDSAFARCSGLTTITLPESVTNIGDSAFYGCSGLITIVLPESVTSIGDYAFSRCSGLTIITLPEGVTSIGSSVFANCSGLTTITLPEGVTSIGSAAFSGCSGLITIVLPEGVTSIGDDAFSYCSGLTTITLPEGITSIGGWAFSGCSCLTTITLPDSVTSIGFAIFSDCSGLTTITIPDGLTIISDAAFRRCRSLTSITLPEGVTSIGSSTFYGCSSLTSITLPEGITRIASSTFYGCNSLTSIILPEGVTSIGNGAFSDCSSLTSITIPGSVTTIDHCAFSDCSSLTSITIPGNVTSIGNYAFSTCVSLSSVRLPAGISLGAYVFEGSDSLIQKIYYSNQYEFKTVGDDASTIIKYTGSDSDITLPSQVAGSPEFKVTSIDDGVFKDLASLESIIIPDTVTTIGASTFENCSNLESVEMTASMTHIGADAFKDCLNLKMRIIKNDYVKSYCIENNIDYLFIIDPVATLTLSKPSPSYDDALTVAITEDNSDSDNFSYQWYRNDTPIIGASASTYNVGQEDIGQRLKVRVSADDWTTRLDSSETDLVIKAEADIDFSLDADIITYMSISVIDVVGCEYKLEDGSWQDSHVFTGLTDETAYRVYMRKKETETHEASTSLSGVFTTVDEIDGTVTITTANPKYDDELSLSIAIDSNTPEDFTYQWFREANPIGGATEATYVVVEDDIGTSIKASVTSTSGAGTLISPLTNPVAKADQVVTDPIALDNITDSSITLIEYAGYEYSIDDGSSWQNSGEFDGLSARTGYTISMRKKETSTHTVSNRVQKVIETFAPFEGNVSINLVSPKFGDLLEASISADNSITKGFTYKWYRDGSVISGADASTYTLVAEDVGHQIKVTVEADDCTGSLESNMTQVVVKAVQVLADDVTSEAISDSSISIKAYTGCEYSIDNGLTWQTSNQFSSLQEKTTYTISQRLKETDSHYASNQKSASFETLETEKETSGSGSSSGGSSSKRDKSDRDSSSSSRKENATSQQDKKAERISISDAMKNQDGNLKVSQDDIEVIFYGDAFKEMNGKDVQVEIKEVNKDELKLTEDLKAKIGDLPIVDISVYVDNKKLDFDTDERIEIDVALKTSYAAHKIVPIYIHDDGRIEIVEGRVINGMMKFSTSHLSHYGLMYSDASFSDLIEHWSKEAVEALAARQVIKGRTEDLYDPNGQISRAEFVTLMVRYFDLPVGTSETYKDIEEDAWYTDYVLRAKAQNILPDVYGDVFEPNKPISREDMMYILYQSLEKSNKLNWLEDCGCELDNYMDCGQVAAYAKDSAACLVSKGLIDGSEDKKLNPKSTTTRGEVAQVLYNLLIEQY